MGRRADNQVIGVCRFSYPSLGGFKLSSRGPEAVIDALYDPERLRRRFALFEAICLPSLAAQSDLDFTLVVLAGDAMPLRWRRRLRALRSRYPFLAICAAEPLGPLQATRRAFRVGADERVPFVTGFRIDDDDALAVDYVERLRETADRMLDLGWADAETPVAIGYQTGLYWSLDDPDFALYRHSETRPTGQGTAMVAPFDFQQNIFRWNHAYLAAHVRCWTDPAPVMFLRTLHGGNDSGRSIPRKAVKLSVAEGERHLRERFGLRLPRLRAMVEGAGGDQP
jgi:hypothetical protein